MISKIKNLYFLIPALIFLLIYWKSIFFGAVWGDDPMVISPPARDFNLMLKSFYDNSHYSGVHYLPMYYLQYFLVNKIFGENAYPFGFHVYHLFAQFLVCVFATLVFNKITKNRLFSVIVVAFWIMHPINLQMSTRVLVSAGVMGFAFCLIFIYLNLRLLENSLSANKWFYVILSNLFFLIALMTGENFFFYPILLYVISFYLKGKSIFSKKYLYLYVSLLVVLPVYLILRFVACGGNMFNSSTSDELLSWTETGGIKDMLFRGVWLSPQLIVHYFKLFLWPFGLMDSKAEWYTVGNSIFGPYSLFCQFLVLSLILSIFFLYKQAPLFSIGVAWFFISSVLYLQIIPLFTIAGVRYAYVPSMGLMLAIFSLVFGCSNIKVRKVLLILAVPIFLFLVNRTIYYLPSSKDLLTQYIYCAKEAPLWNSPLYFAKAVDLAQTEKKEKELPEWLSDVAFSKVADQWLNKYMDLKPGMDIKYGPMQMAYNFYSFRGIFKYLFYSGQYEKLNKVMNTALKVNDGWIGWYEIAKFLKDTKQWEQSWQALKIAIGKKPAFKHSYDLRFISIAIQSNNVKEAERLIKNYIELSSYPSLFAGYFYLKINKPNEAMKNFKVAIGKDKKISVGEDFFYMTAVHFFIDNKDISNAKQTLDVILSYNPFNKEAKNLLNELNDENMPSYKIDLNK